MAMPELDDEMGDDEPSAKDSMGMGMMGEDMGGGMRDDFTVAAEEAFPEMAGQPERISALKDLVRICLEEDREGGYDKPEADKPKSSLALIFGPKKKG